MLVIKKLHNSLADKSDEDSWVIVILAMIFIQYFWAFRVMIAVLTFVALYVYYDGNLSSMCKSAEVYLPSIPQ